MPARSPDQLARDVATAVRRLVTAPDLRLKMGEAAREHVAATHLWERKVDRMVELYEQVAATRFTSGSQASG